MNIKLPEKVNRIINALMDEGYEAYAVGGCIRDSLLSRIPNDWDITTSATPQQVKEVFHKTVDTGIAHGTVTVLLSGEGFEVTTYRIDGEYEDARHPKEVIFTSLLSEDLRRRDFTINAMAYNERDGLVDLFEGQKDLERGVIRAVGDPMERFSEDALRIMRAIRFAGQLGYEIDEETAKAAKVLAPNLQKISAERINTELTKLMASDHPELMRLAYQLGITKQFMPEFDLIMETDQINPHHCYSVGEHTIHAFCYIKKEDYDPDEFLTLRLAMLFHDFGKPSCMTRDEKGIDHFYGHPAVSSEIADRIMRCLKYDNRRRQLVVSLAKNHDLHPKMTYPGVRRFMNKMGLEVFFLYLKVQRADVMAQSDYQREEKLQKIEEVTKMADKIIEDKDPLFVRDLAINGNDLISNSIAKGQKIGQILGELMSWVIEDPSRNEKERLMEKAREISET